MNYEFILVWTSYLLSHLSIKTFIILENSPGNKYSQVINNYLIISYFSSTFRLVSQSNELI